MSVLVLTESLAERRGSVLDVFSHFSFLSDAFSEWVKFIGLAELVDVPVLEKAIVSGQSLSTFLKDVFPGLSSSEQASVREFLYHFQGFVVPCHGLLSLGVARVDVGEPTSDEKLLILAQRCLQDHFTGVSSVPEYMLLPKFDTFSKRQCSLLQDASRLFYAVFVGKGDSVRLLRSAYSGFSGRPREASGELSLEQVREVLLSFCSDLDYRSLVRECTSSEDFFEELRVLCALAYACFDSSVYSASFLDGLCRSKYVSVAGEYRDVFDWFFRLFDTITVPAVTELIISAKAVGCITSADLHWLVSVFRSAMR